MTSHCLIYCWFIVNWTHKNHLWWKFQSEFKIKNWACCQVWCYTYKHNIDGLMQERQNSIANALELCLSCTNPIWHKLANFAPDRFFHKNTKYTSANLILHQTSFSRNEAWAWYAPWLFGGLCEGCVKVPDWLPTLFHPRHAPCYIDGLAQDCGNSSVLALKLPQSCAKLFI